MKPRSEPTRLPAAKGTAAAAPSASPQRVDTYGAVNVPKPLWSQLPHDECMDANGVPLLKNIMLHFLRQGRLFKEDAMDIAQRAAALLYAESNTLQLSEPVTVVGDIYGQFYDLAKIFTLGGKIGNGTKYLFLGNYTSGNGFSCECLLFLLAAKVAFPAHVYLLRGNHECRFMTHLLGFEKECVRKYSKVLYNSLMSACNRLPLAALVSEKYFCVHGGLSPDISRVSDIDHIHRFREIPTKGAMCDLLWSDPYYDVENPASPESASTDYYSPGTGAFDVEPRFLANELRGCGFLFNFACVKHFANVNKLLCVIRSNEVQDEGYKLYRPHPNNNYPSMFGVCSAPNYCDTFDNKGAILHIAVDTINVTQFVCSPHPIELNGLDGISWSLPFLWDTTQTALADIMGKRGFTSAQSDTILLGPEDSEEASGRSGQRNNPGKR